MSAEHSLHRTAAGGRARRRPLRAAGRVRRGRFRIRPRLLLAIVVLAAVLGGGWMLLRDSSFVAVRTVTITGADSTAAPRIRDALDTAARGMSTLHVRDADLQRAVAPFPSVAGLRVRTDFPHRLIIEVLERRPVAAVAAGSQIVAVTGDGRVLRDIDAPPDVPEIRYGTPPAGPRVTDPRLEQAVAVAGAAPPALRAKTISIQWGAHGVYAKLESGPPLIFGSGADAAAKWAGAARVLADPGSAGATYLDLRIPGRVAAGGVGPVTQEAPAGPQIVPTPTPIPTPSTIG